MNGVNLVATLRYVMNSTLDGVPQFSLCGSALSIMGGIATRSFCWGLLYRTAAHFLMTAMCFGLFKAVMGMNFLNAARRLVMVVTVLSCVVMTSGI